MKNKILAIVIAAAMVLSLVPMTAFAAGNPITGEPYPGEGMMPIPPIFAVHAGSGGMADSIPTVGDLEEGQVYVNKNVSDVIDESTGTFEITLYVGGTTYIEKDKDGNVLNPDPKKPLGDVNNPNDSGSQVVTIIDGIGAGFAYNGDADYAAGNLEEADGVVKWMIHQDDILSGVISATFTVSLKEGWETDEWYYTNNGASATFRPMYGNPYYWTEREEFPVEFKVSNPSWNKDGINSITLKDELLGPNPLTFNFNNNNFPIVVNGVTYTKYNAGKPAMPPDSYAGYNYGCYATAPPAGAIGAVKTYVLWFTGLEGLNVLTEYRITVPNEGGNEVMEAFSIRAIGYTEPTKKSIFTWGGNDVLTGLPNEGQIELTCIGGNLKVTADVAKQHDEVVWHNVYQQDYHKVNKQDFHNVVKQDFHNVNKQDYHDVYKQDFHNVNKQDFHNVNKQDYHDVYKQDFHDVYKQDFHNVLKQDFHNVYKQDFHEVNKQDFHDVYKQDFHNVVKQDYHNVLAQDYHNVLKQDYHNVYKQDYHNVYSQGFYNVLKQDYHNVLAQDYHNVLAQDYHNVLKQDYHDVLAQDYHNVLAQDYHNVLAQDYHNVLAQDYHNVLKQDFHNQLKQDYWDVYQKDIEEYYIPSFEKKITSVSDTVVTWRDGGNIAGGTFGNGMTYLEIDVEKAKASPITFWIGDSSKSNKKIVDYYFYNVRVEGNELVVTFDERLISTNVTVKLYSTAPKASDPSSHKAITGGEIRIPLPTTSGGGNQGNTVPTASATMSGNNVTITVKNGSAAFTKVVAFEKNKTTTYDVNGYSVQVAYNGNGIKSVNVISGSSNGNSNGGQQPTAPVKAAPTASAVVKGNDVTITVKDGSETFTQVVGFTKNKTETYSFSGYTVEVSYNGNGVKAVNLVAYPAPAEPEITIELEQEDDGSATGNVQGSGLETVYMFVHFDGLKCYTTGEYEFVGWKLFDRKEYLLPFGESQGVPYFFRKISDGTPYFSAKALDGTPYFSEKVLDNAPYFSEKVLDGTPYFSEKVLDGTPYLSEKVSDGVPYFFQKIDDGALRFSEKALDGDPKFFKKVLDGDPKFFKKVLDGDPYFSAKVFDNDPYFSAKVLDGDAKFSEKVFDNDPYFSAKGLDGDEYFFEKVLDNDPYFSDKVLDGDPKFFKKVLDGTEYFFEKVLDNDPYFSDKVLDGAEYFFEKVLDNDPYFFGKVLDGDPYFFEKALDNDPYFFGKVLDGDPYFFEKVSDGTPYFSEKIEDSRKTVKDEYNVDFDLTVNNAAGESVFKGTIANGGENLIPDLLAGEYTVCLYYNDGEVNETKTVTIMPGETVKVEFSNILVVGDDDVTQDADETIDGVKGEDMTIDGVKGEDVTIDGEQGEDVTIDGEQGEDVTIDGVQGEDVTIDGEQGADVTIDGEQGEDVTIDGEQGADVTIDGEQGEDETIDGEQGEDETIDGVKGADVTIDGVQGEDETIDGVKGADVTIDGVKGEDETIDGTKSEDETIDGTQGKDETIDGTQGKDETVDGVQGADETIDGTQGADVTIDGTQGADVTIDGTQGANMTIDGTQGADVTIDGVKGADVTIEGKQGADVTIDGAKGADDVIIGDKLNDVIVAGEKYPDIKYGNEYPEDPINFGIGIYNPTRQ